jgi:hypothetical protein
MRRLNPFVLLLIFIVPICNLQSQTDHNHTNFGYRNHVGVDISWHPSSFYGSGFSNEDNMRKGAFKYGLKVGHILNRIADVEFRLGILPMHTTLNHAENVGTQFELIESIEYRSKSYNSEIVLRRFIGARKGHTVSNGKYIMIGASLLGFWNVPNHSYQGTISTSALEYGISTSSYVSAIVGVGQERMLGRHFGLYYEISSRVKYVRINESIKIIVVPAGENYFTNMSASDYIREFRQKTFLNLTFGMKCFIF